MAQRNLTPFDLGLAALNAGVTLWWRWPVLLSGGATKSDRAELTRMVSEKAKAATAGMLAAQTETMRIAAAALTGHLTPNAPNAIAAAALTPALRTVKANAKRLARQQR